MEPVIPSSFIPKRPIDGTDVSTTHRTHTVGVLSLITTVVVIGTALAFGGVYLYEQQLTAQKKKLESSIVAARDGIGTDFVSDMKRLDARIAGVKTLIKNHVVVTPIFKELEARTLRSVQYKDFSYTYTPDDKTKSQQVQVDLTGTARSYATIALQSDAFSQSDLIKNPVFSNLTVDDKTRTINFKLTFTVDPAALSYQTFVDSTIKPVQQAVPSVPAEVETAPVVNQPTP